MALGYETFEDNRDFKKEGLTGDVKRYVTESMTYPCYIISLASNIAKYKLDVLKNMFTLSKVYNEELSMSSIDIYFDSGEKLIKFGKISSAQVKSFLKLFDSEQIIGYLDKNTKLEGDYLYVLSD